MRLSQIKMNNVAYLNLICLWFKGDGYAGDSNISKNELKKIIKKLPISTKQKKIRATSKRVLFL